MNRLNYIGCKHTLSPNILKIIRSNVPNLNQCHFGDLFAGTGSISFYLEPHVAHVSANDNEYYAYVINRGLLCCSYSENLRDIIVECNLLERVPGLVYENFSPHASCERMFFTNENAMKCDAIRQYIETLYDTESIDEREYYFLLASLLVSMDKVANTASIYGAYLKEFKASALKELKMEPIHRSVLFHQDANCVYQRDINSLVRDTEYDVVYLDPPYNQRQYGANYSPLNYIAHYSSNIEIKGKTGLISDYSKSDYCKKDEVVSCFDDLLRNLRAKYVFISYNNEGLMEESKMRELFGKYGSLKLYKMPYHRYKSHRGIELTEVFEYLWVIRRDESAGGYEEIYFSDDVI